MKNNFFIKFISLFLVISILVSNLFACITPPNEENNYTETPTGGEVVDPSTDSNTNTNEKTPDNTTNNQGTIPEDGEDIEQLGSSFISTDWHDYVGDLETFVYGLLITKLEYIYDIFPAYVQLSSGYYVYGLAYTDYSECYTNDDETKVYFTSGFLPFAGELEIPQEDFDTGLYLNNLEYQDEETFFVWKYKSEQFLEHCVVYGTYLQYGVDIYGYITYNAIPFDREKCDTSLGSLYSYDESRYLYDVDFGEYIPISGITLSETFDYKEFEKEVNAFIEEQNANWVSYDVQTVAYNSQEAVEAYLLSLQEETFLGCSVEQLIEATKDLDPLQCFRVTPEGLSIIDLEEMPPEGPSALAKWLVGSACSIVIGVGIVGSMVFSACPPLSSIAGAVTGAAIETFMQVIIENKNLGDIQWTKVGVAAVSGAVSGLLGPYLQTLNGVSYFFVDSVVDGLIGATEQAVFAMMDGADGEEILARFGKGFVLGAGFSAAFKVAGKLLSMVGQGLSAAAQAIANKLPAKLTKSLSKFAKPFKEFGNAIGDAFNKLKQKADSSIFHSEFISKKMMSKTLATLTKVEKDELFDLSIGRGVMSADRIVDVNGNNFSKATLKEAWSNAKNGDILGYINEGGARIPVHKFNETISIYPKDLYPTVSLSKKQYNKYSINDIRKENLDEARELFREYFYKNSGKIPETLINEIKLRYTDSDVVEALKTMTPTSLKKVFEASGALHENLDGTVTFMPKEIHSKIGHMGGAALEYWVRQHMGKIYFETFVSAAASGAVVGGLNG